MIKHIGKVGLLLFLIGASLEAEPGARLEWMPYVLIAAGLLMMLLFAFIEKNFYMGDGQ